VGRIMVVCSLIEDHYYYSETERDEIPSQVHDRERKDVDENFLSVQNQMQLGYYYFENHR